MTWYVWSNISSGKDKSGRPIQTVVGEEVTAGSLGLTDEQFSELIVAGAVRKERYPDILPGSTMAPAEFYKRQAMVAEGKADPSDMDEAQIERFKDGREIAEPKSEEFTGEVAGPSEQTSTSEPGRFGV
jgi:hypothetical protein